MHTLDIVGLISIVTFLLAYAAIEAASEQFLMRHNRTENYLMISFIVGFVSCIAVGIIRGIYYFSGVPLP